MKKVRRFAKEQPMNCETREAFLNLRLDMMFAGIKALSCPNNNASCY